MEKSMETIKTNGAIATKTAMALKGYTMEDVNKMIGCILNEDVPEVELLDCKVSWKRVNDEYYHLKVTLDNGHKITDNVMDNDTSRIFKDILREGIRMYKEEK